MPKSCQFFKQDYPTKSVIFFLPLGKRLKQNYTLKCELNLLKLLSLLYPYYSLGFFHCFFLTLNKTVAWFPAPKDPCHIPIFTDLSEIIPISRVKC